MHHLKFSVVLTTAICAGFYSTGASALALGAITVQSALGEPLRAEIDLPQITPAEAEALRATTATAEVFQAQGMEYTQAVSNLQIQLQRRPDGTAVLRLSGARPVNEPFIDLVLDANWGSGRIVRNYTMLFDPPVLRRAAPAVTTAPQVAAAVAQPAVPGPGEPAAAASAVARRPAPADGVTVQAGDTAGRIVAAYKPKGVSLDQMLVALLHANPGAFIQGNVNRLRAGAVLQMPDQAAAQATTAPQARQILAVQARDFDEFRRKLAGAAPVTRVAAARRSASGTVRAQVQDKKPATTAPDRLTLSKGSVKGRKAAAEEQLAKDKQAGETATRMAELSKNINDLNKLGSPAPTAGSSDRAGSSTPAAGAASTGVTVQVPAVPATPTVPPAPETAQASGTTASATASDAPAETPAAAPAPAPAAKPKPKPAPVPIEEPDLLSTLMADPLLPVGASVVLAGLLGFGGYRMLRRRANRGVNDADEESRAAPESFFGTSGGQRVDTANSGTSKASVMPAYSPSQLDVGGDVDPVAEADVYLAYGRDQQAEEILKDAVRHNPGRVSVHVKLAEIHARRRDRKALEAVAGAVFKLTQGEGLDWARIVELGRGLDPDNPLYQPGGRLMGDSAFPPLSSPASPSGTGRPAAAPPAGLDFDLNLDLPDTALPRASGKSAATPATPAAAPGKPVAAAPAAPPGKPPAPVAAVVAPGDRSRASTGAGSDVSETLRSRLDLPAPVAAPSTAPASVVRQAQDAIPGSLNVSLHSPTMDMLPSRPMEFDLGKMSLDLAPSSPMKAPVSPASESVDGGLAVAQDDPLSTKLALAEEFDAIGDSDGARTLIEEVMAESSGVLRTRAQQMLAKLG